MTDRITEIRALLVNSVGSRAADLPETQLLGEPTCTICDSLDFVEFVMAVEEKYEIAIDDDEAETMRSIASAAAFVDQRLGG